jgi:beta-mannosidase
MPVPAPGHLMDALFPPGSPERATLHEGKSFRPWEWVAEEAWVFERTFTPALGLAENRAFLRFDGIDDQAEVWLNGRMVGEHDGQFRPAEWEVTGLLRAGQENSLRVIVQVGEGANRWKTAFMAEDGSTLRQVGLWGSVSLVITGPARILSSALHTNISLDRTEAALSVVSEFQAGEVIAAIVATEITMDGLPVTSVEDPIRLFPGETTLVQSCEIPRLRLWWPNGHGPQPLYRARVSLVDAGGRLLDQRVFDFGVRSLEAVPCDGAGPDTLPYGLQVNGRRIWIKGWHWLPADLFYGSVPTERYEELLTRARDSGANLIRVNGAGLVEKEAFYSICDRLGLLVWQDFPQHAECPPATPEYVAYVEHQAEAILALRINHPSLAIWCGGDELLDADGTPLGSDHPALAALRSVVEAEDPRRIWLPASPSGPHARATAADAGMLHDAHGPLQGPGLKDFPSLLNAIDPRLHGKVAARPDPGQLNAAFGALDQDAVPSATRFLETLGLQYAMEAARRRQWSCAGVVPLCLKSAAGPSCFPVSRAYAPFHVSAAFPTFAWAEEPVFHADVWLHNEGPERSLLNVVATVTGLSGRELYQESLAGEAPENGSEGVGDLSWRFPAGFAEPFILRLEVIDEEGETLARNLYPHSRAPEAPFAAFLRPEHAGLQTEFIGE